MRELGMEGRQAWEWNTDWELMEGQRTFSFDAHDNPSENNQPNFEDEEPEVLKCEVPCLVRYLDK